MKKEYVNRQSTENPIVDWIVVKIASLLVKPLSRTNITPNMITLFSFFLGVLASALLALNKYPLLIILSIFFSFVFDRVDGGLARMKKATSKIGNFLDNLFDRFIDALLIIGLCFNLFNKTHDFSIWLYGLLFLTGIYITFTVGILISGGYSESSISKSRNSILSKSSILNYFIIGHGTRMFALIFFIIINKLLFMLIFFAIIQNLYWLGLAFVYIIKLAREKEEAETTKKVKRKLA